MVENRRGWETSPTNFTEVDNSQSPIADSRQPTANNHFGKDRNFYLFSFPLHRWVSLWVQITLWVTCVVVGLLYNFYYRQGCAYNAARETAHHFPRVGAMVAVAARRRVAELCAPLEQSLHKSVDARVIIAARLVLCRFPPRRCNTDLLRGVR